MINFMIKIITFSLSLFILITNILFAQSIDSFVIKGNERISTETIKVFSGFDKGDNITEKDLNKILKNLYETNFFKNVEVQIDNKNLIIIVTENEIIQEVIIEGIKKDS